MLHYINIIRITAREQIEKKDENISDTLHFINDFSRNYCGLEFMFIFFFGGSYESRDERELFLCLLLPLHVVKVKFPDNVGKKTKQGDVEKEATDDREQKAKNCRKTNKVDFNAVLLLLSLFLRNTQKK